MRTQDKVECAVGMEVWSPEDRGSRLIHGTVVPTSGGMAIRWENPDSSAPFGLSGEYGINFNFSLAWSSPALAQDALDRREREYADRRMAREAERAKQERRRQHIAEGRALREQRDRRCEEIEAVGAQASEEQIAEYFRIRRHRRAATCYECESPLPRGMGYEITDADPDAAGAGQDGGDVIYAAVCEDCLRRGIGFPARQTVEARAQ